MQHFYAHRLTSAVQHLATNRSSGSLIYTQHLATDRLTSALCKYYLIIYAALGHRDSGMRGHRMALATLERTLDTAPKLVGTSTWLLHPRTDPTPAAAAAGDSIAAAEPTLQAAVAAVAAAAVRNYTAPEVARSGWSEVLQPRR